MTDPKYLINGMRYSACDKINHLVDQIMIKYTDKRWSTANEFNVTKAFLVLPRSDLTLLYSHYPENIRDAIEDLRYAPDESAFGILDYIQFEIAHYHAVECGDTDAVKQLLELKTQYAEVINILITRDRSTHTPAMLALVSKCKLRALPMDYYIKNSRISLNSNGCILHVYNNNLKGGFINVT